MTAEDCYFALFPNSIIDLSSDVQHILKEWQPSHIFLNQ